MKQMKTYEKPRIQCRSLLNKEAVAEDCWSPAHDTAWGGYYNDPGYGGVYFTMASTGEKCGSQFTILRWIGNSGADVTKEDYVANHPEYTYETVENSIHSELSGYLTGNDGTNFHANPPKVTQDPPPEPWSV